MLGPNAEHLDSLADNRVPVADVGSLAMFALQVVAAIGVGAITSAPLRVSNHHHAMSGVAA
jgi:hypothetical protein